MADHKIEFKVTEGDMAWMFYLSIDGVDVVRQFVTPAIGQIIKKHLDALHSPKKRGKKDAEETIS